MAPPIYHTQTVYTELDNLTAKRIFLKNSELKAMSFSHIKDEKHRRCLLNAALTCKDFLDLALDALWEVMGSLVPLLKLLPALQLELDPESEDDAYVRANKNFHVFLYDFYLVYRSLVGMCLRQIGIDCNITLEKSRFTALTPPSIPSILQLMFELLNIFGHFLSFHHFVASSMIWIRGIIPISSFFYRRSLIRLRSTISKASKMLLLEDFWLPFQVPLRCSVGSPLILERYQRTF